MFIITPIDMATKPTGELRGLLTQAFRTAGALPEGTPGRRLALAQISALQAELRLREP